MVREAEVSEYGQRVTLDAPAPTVQTHGNPKTFNEMTGSVISFSPAPPTDSSKPPYRVQSMAEIAAVPANGYSLVSTFSGCGGSCLGFEMMGYRVLWASEFVPAAQEVYRLNHPDTILDTRDIRTVTAEDTLAATGLKRGDLDVLEGSPPCASFSTAGKREKDWGKIKAYSDTAQRADDLFFEYVRLLDGLQPKVFVAENVSGLVKGTAKGYFKRILAAMKACGYRVEAKLLDAQWLGVPQMRQRIIFVGVRNDLGVAPAFPMPLAYRYSVRDALPWITGVEDANGYRGHEFYGIDRPMDTVQAQRSVRVAVSAYRDNRGAFGNGGDITDQPSPTVLSDSVGTHWIDETDISRYAIGAEWDKLKPGEASDKYFSLKRAPLDGPSPTVSQRGGNGGAATVTHPTERRKFTIAELKRICAFPDDFILTGTYAQQWERLGRAVPPVMMAHVARVIRDEVLSKCKP
jgi:DNA (cytosine-5)-methyltransferase 1